MSTKWSRNQTEKAVQDILGIFGRVWVRDGKVAVGLERGSQRLILAYGNTCQEAFEAAFITPVRVVDTAGGMEKFRQRYADLKNGLLPEETTPVVGESSATPPVAVPPIEPVGEEVP